jgi:plastocyanin
MMRRLGVLVVLFLTVGAIPAADAATRVTVRDFSFIPTPVRVVVGAAVTWSNNGPSTHTATSNQGFFNAGRIAPGSAKSATMVSAGGFAYHCQIHPSMRGVVNVPVTVRPRGPVMPGTRLTIRVASKVLSGRTYRVQRRLGTGAWTTIAMGVNGPTLAFTPQRRGRFGFRARVSRPSGTSGWSPVVNVQVTA